MFLLENIYVRITKHSREFIILITYLLNNVVVFVNTNTFLVPKAIHFFNFHFPLYNKEVGENNVLTWPQRRDYVTSCEIDTKFFLKCNFSMLCLDFLLHRIHM